LRRSEAAGSPDQCTLTLLLLMAVASTMLTIPMVTPTLKKPAGLVVKSG